MQTLQNYQQKLQDFRKAGSDGSRLSSSSQLPTASSPGGIEGNTMEPRASSARSSANQEETSSSSIEGRASFDVNIMKEGYLQKKGQLLKGWKRRWFVCDGRTLAYYASSKDKKPNMVIPLDSCTVQDGGMSETWNSSRIYVTDGTCGTVYCLSAEDGTEVTEWLKVLQTAAARVQESNTTKISLPKMAPDYKSSSPLNRRRKLAMKPSYKQIPTDLKLENELTNAFETIQALMKSRTDFQLQRVQDGVRMSLYTDPKTERTYARGSVVINAAPDVVRQLVSDVSHRGEWDIQFPSGTILASYGVSTELVYLTGTCCTETPMAFPTSATAAIGALMGATAGYLTAAIDPSLGLLLGAGIGAMSSSMDCSKWTRNRDMLMVKHIRDHSDGSYVVIERSVSNELKPPQSGVTRAFTTASGFLIQPLQVENRVEPVLQSLLTYITDVDVGGWAPADYKKAFLLERVKNLANIREYIVQEYIFNREDECSLVDDVNELFAIDESTSDGWNPTSWRRGMLELPTGGLKLTDKEIAKKQKGVLMEVLRSFGAAILEGKSAVSLSLPVRIFEPRSMLERIVDLWLYAPIFLTRAAEATDPVERFKLVMCFAFAGLHHGVCPLKPFNPILGETYQTELSDGSSICCEHTSHHPPISNFQIHGKGYMVWGYFIFGGSFKTNALTQTQTGPVHVDFDDGTRVSYNMPYLRHGGFLWGDRIVEILGNMDFQDEKNRLSCNLRLNPDEKKGMGGMFSSAKTPSDICRGTLLSDSTELCEVSGSWLRELAFGDDKLWDIDRDVCQGTSVLPDVLPSDCRFRDDLRHLKDEHLEGAQEWKIKLEKLQRADRTARKDNRRPNHWANQVSH